VCVATIASAAFDEPIEPDAVRKLVKRQAPRPGRKSKE
jgi:hypothetical protein